MREGGRLAAAIEVLSEVLGRHRPAAEALKDWAKAHRFAGSADRHAIGTLVYDVLRRKNSLAARFAREEPRTLVLAGLRDVWGWPVERIGECVSASHGPGPLTEEEKANLERPSAIEPSAHVRGDFPRWLEPSFARAFGEHAAEEGAALARRAPVDLRVNMLKAERSRLLTALGKHGPEAGKLSPWCVRIAPPGPERRNPAVEVEPAHGKGWFEVQDEGSQIAALMSGAKPGEQVADICAGAGGKTLALAAMMGNKGQIHATDRDPHRLRPIFERLQRAGARNVQVIGSEERERLDALEGRVDCAVIDAPCSGSGSWRRKPDAKWRLTPKQLEQRLIDQVEVLDRGAKLVRPGGRLLYITCSVLPEENEDQAAAFLVRHPSFSLLPYREQWRAAIGTDPPGSAIASETGLQLTPAGHATDGFFISVLCRAA